LKMVGKINYGKLLAVAFLTVLIWVWADRALDAELPVFNAVVSVAKSGNPNLGVSFNDEPLTLIEEIIFVGPASKISRVRREVAEGKRFFEFYLDPAKEAMDTSGRHTLYLLNFLKKNDEIRELGLSVKSCKPETISVDVIDLVKMPLEIKCVDNQQNPIKDAVIEPVQVEMFVPENWRGEKLVAKVVLTREEIEQARVSAVEKTPFIELPAGQIKEAHDSVRIRMPRVGELLKDYTITTTTFGYNLSANLQGKYTVEVTNIDAVMSAIAIKATPEAKRAYENMTFQVIIEIDDSDKDIKSDEPLRKELIYNFPAEYVRRDEIMLNQQPVVARFKLKPLHLTGNGSNSAD